VVVILGMFLILKVITLLWEWWIVVNDTKKISRELAFKREVC
jgi:hypothetical protein